MFRIKEPKTDFIKNLPYDIQRSIYLRTLLLRKPKKVLTNELKDAIESYHLIHELRKYYRYIYRDHHDHFYLQQLQNDMLYELNDGVPVMIGLSTTMIKMFRNQTNVENHFEN